MWQQAQARLETTQEAQRLKTCLTNRIYESSQASKGKQLAIKQMRQRRRATGAAGEAAPFLHLVTNLQAVALVESHREAGFYLPNWCAQMAKTCLSRDSVSLEQSSVHARTSKAPRLITGHIFRFLLERVVCWSALGGHFLCIHPGRGHFHDCSGTESCVRLFFALSAFTFSLRVQIQRVLYFFSFI